MSSTSTSTSTVAVDRALTALEAFAAVADSNLAIVKDLQHLRALLQVERMAHTAMVDKALALAHEVSQLRALLRTERQAHAAALATTIANTLASTLATTVQDAMHAALVRAQQVDAHHTQAMRDQVCQLLRINPAQIVT